MIQRLMNENRTTRENLQCLVKQCSDLVRRMPETILQDLFYAFPNVVAHLQAIDKELNENHCVILVAGMFNLRSLSVVSVTFLFIFDYVI